MTEQQRNQERAQGRERSARRRDRLSLDERARLQIAPPTGSPGLKNIDAIPATLVLLNDCSMRWQAQQKVRLPILSISFLDSNTTPY